MDIKSILDEQTLNYKEVEMINSIDSLKELVENCEDILNKIENSTLTIPAFNQHVKNTMTDAKMKLAHQNAELNLLREAKLLAQYYAK